MFLISKVLFGRGHSLKTSKRCVRQVRLSDAWSYSTVEALYLAPIDVQLLIMNSLRQGVCGYETTPLYPPKPA